MLLHTYIHRYKIFFQHCLCIIFLLAIYAHLNVIEDLIHLKYVSNYVVIDNKQESSGSLSIRKKFIVSLFISVQIPSNFVCTCDIYIKNTKLYIHNRILYFYCDCLKIKMQSDNKSKNQ